MTQKPSKANEIERIFKLISNLEDELQPAQITLRYLTENVYGYKNTSKYQQEIDSLQIMIFGVTSLRGKLASKTNKIIQDEYINQPDKGN